MAKHPTRRQFLAAASAGAALSLTATSYARIVGANERIALGLIGCGGRGYDGAHAGRPPARQAAERRVHRGERPVADPARACGGSLPGVVRPRQPGSSSPIARSWT